MACSSVIRRQFKSTCRLSGDCVTSARHCLCNNKMRNRVRRRQKKAKNTRVFIQNHMGQARVTIGWSKVIRKSRLFFSCSNVHRTISVIAQSDTVLSVCYTINIHSYIVSLYTTLSFLKKVITQFVYSIVPLNSWYI